LYAFAPTTQKVGSPALLWIASCADVWIPSVKCFFLGRCTLTCFSAVTPVPGELRRLLTANRGQIGGTDGARKEALGDKIPISRVNNAPGQYT
jgi:hypothetical protein